MDALETLGQLREAFTIVDTTVALLRGCGSRSSRGTACSSGTRSSGRLPQVPGPISLLSEDLQDGFRAEGMLVLNPFVPANAEQLDRLLPG